MIESVVDINLGIPGRFDAAGEGQSRDLSQFPQFIAFVVLSNSPELSDVFAIDCLSINAYYVVKVTKNPRQ